MSEVVDTAPAREEFVAELPDEAPTGRSSDAPWGYKKDGTPARQRGRQAGYKLGTRSTRGSLETQIGAFLVTFNTPLRLIPALQNDALDQVEILALAKSMDQECQRSARFRKYVEQMLRVQGATSLIAVVAIIAGRRVVRHGLVPIPDEMGGAATVDAMLGGAISMMSGQGAINPNLVVMGKEAAAS